MPTAISFLRCRCRATPGSGLPPRTRSRAACRRRSGSSSSDPGGACMSSATAAVGHNLKMARAVTEEERASAQELLTRARAAMAAIDHYDQQAVDRLCRAVAWATANEQTFGRLTRMSVDESEMGSAEGVPA